jgi:hypothetical protein
LCTTLAPRRTLGVLGFESSSKDKHCLLGAVVRTHTCAS